MKKVIAGLILLIIVLVAVFREGLAATFTFYDFLNDHPEVAARADINWREMSFTSTAKSGTTNPPLTIGNMTLPVPFAATYETGGNFTHAHNGALSMTLFAPERPDFFTTYADDFTTAEENIACTLLKKSTGVVACRDARTFYEALLKFKSTDINLFSSKADKDIALKLLIIKSKDQLSNGASKFETEHGTGFLYYVGTDSYSIYFFTDPDTRYAINLKGLSKADTAYVLSNMLVGN
ncbi:MAG: hypothetical protein KC877_00065 [Candidatus Kaiserbacteria bacterium]|nr:hypothetical protein [Candidatus Kaiserbacteria bacterium]MCB9816624.1 hypothetical protein [Candidatus Nomurabacteria bacterium]